MQGEQVDEATCDEEGGWQVDGNEMLVTAAMLRKCMKHLQQM